MDTTPNLADYDALRDVFEWESIYADADWDAPDEINIAYEVCDRHATKRGTVALFFVGRDGERERITFWELTHRSNRFANVLEGLGLERGDHVFAYMPRTPERYVAMLGTVKAGYVFGGIHERYGTDRIAYRLRDSKARVVLTTPERRDAVDAALEGVESVEHVVVVSDDGTGIYRDDCSYHAEMSSADPSYEPVETSGSDPALLYYTSGEGVRGRPRDGGHVGGTHRRDRLTGRKNAFGRRTPGVGRVRRVVTENRYWPDPTKRTARGWPIVGYARDRSVSWLLETRLDTFRGGSARDCILRRSGGSAPDDSAFWQGRPGDDRTILLN